MTAGIFARVPTIAVIVVAALLATATLTLAATKTGAAPAPATPTAAAEPATLVVPDVRNQAYVFAKGTLEQSGFAWKVVGSVQGYAANVVSVQTPAPGTRVIADGAPIISLSLARDSSHKQEGVPENEAPYVGTPVRLLVPKRAAHPRAAAVKPARKPALKPAVKPTVKSATKVPRTPAFRVSGAPSEPLDEISLPSRAQQLDRWLDSHRQPTQAAVEHWLYQHNWIVTGASFGWSGGVEALRALVAVDRRVQKLWGVGARSERLARAALTRAKARAH
jgi:hypothetical protein